MFADNAHFRDYERMIVELHKMMADGQSSSPAANDLRERMEIPEAHVSSEELRVLNNLSGDLYMIEGREVADTSAVNCPLDELPRELSNAQASGDLLRILAILRTMPDFLDASQIASMRAIVYARLGLLRAALAFADHTQKLDPADWNSARLGLYLAWATGRHADAVNRARSILDDANSPPLARIQAAHSIYSCIDSVQVGLSAELNRAAADLDRIVQNGSSDARIRGNGILGLIKERCGDRDAAIRALQSAVDAATESGSELVFALESKLSELEGEPSAVPPDPDETRLLVDRLMPRPMELNELQLAS